MRARSAGSASTVARVERGGVGLHAERRPQRLQVRHGGQLRAGDPQRVGVDAVQRDPVGVCRVGDRGGPARRPDPDRVEERLVDDLDAARRAGPRRARRPCGGRAGRCAPARPGRGRRRSRRRRRRAAPARCRCWTWPSRGGCAARGSAAPAAARGGRRRRGRARRACRAAGGRARRAPRGSPRAGRRTRAAPRSAGWCRPPRPRRARRAGRAASRRAGRRRPRRARPARARRR